MVTVAWRCSNSIAIGFPTMSLRPITTARRPASATPLRSSSSMTPDGVQGARPGVCCTSRPTFSGWNPSTSFAGSIASKMRRSASSPIPAGSGDCTRMPSTSGSALKASTTRSASSNAADAGRRSSAVPIPSPSPWRILLRT